MDARTLLDNITALLETSLEPLGFDCQPAVSRPRAIGAFGKTGTDRWVQPVMIDGARFYLSVEKDPNQ